MFPERASSGNRDRHAERGFRFGNPGRSDQRAVDRGVVKAPCATAPFPLKLPELPGLRRILGSANRFACGLQPHTGPVNRWVDGAVFRAIRYALDPDGAG
jgi:hypothetical protein